MSGSTGRDDRLAPASPRAPLPRSTGWAHAHPERAKALNEQWRADHPDRVRRISRDYWHRNREQRLFDAEERKSTPEGRRRAAAYQRRAREDPETLRKHREGMAKLRATPEFKERNRERYRCDRRLKELGLPPRRLHKVPAAHRRKFAADADAWFTRKRTKQQVARLRREARPSKAQLRDEALKSPDAVEARITDAVRNMRARKQLVTETLITFGPQLQLLIETTNAHRAARGLSTRNVAQAQHDAAMSIVDRYFATVAPGEQLVDRRAYLNATKPRLLQAVRKQQAALPAFTAPVTSVIPGSSGRRL